MSDTAQKPDGASRVAFTITPRDEVCRLGAIQVLEDMLARARAGEILEVAVAATTPDRCAITSFSFDTRPAILGAIALMQHRILTGT